VMIRITRRPRAKRPVSLARSGPFPPEAAIPAKRPFLADQP
jgi:hypothetical protein